MEGQGSSSISNDDAPMATSNIDNGIANVDVDVDGASSTSSSEEAPAVGPSNIPLMSYFDTDEGELVVIAVRRLHRGMRKIIPPIPPLQRQLLPKQQ